jgi:hypothetical protein
VSIVIIEIVCQGVRHQQREIKQETQETTAASTSIEALHFIEAHDGDFALHPR